MESEEGSTNGVLIRDFDGTMTTHDFYRIALESLVPKDVSDFWSERRAGMITHFEALLCDDQQNRKRSHGPWLAGGSRS